MSWIDLHCHISMLEQSPEEVLSEAEAVGVNKMVTIGTCPDDHPVVLKLAEEYFPKVYCTLGVHPHDANTYDKNVGEFIRSHQSQKEVIGVAEIGLDYYYDNAPREKQRSAFEEQLQIAIETNSPVQIHTRDAEEDTVDILKKFEGKVRGTIHCFTGTRWLSDQCLDLGLNISFSGIVTFKNAEDLREVAKSVPIERLHVETDSPFLTPVPHRGKKNSPKMVVHTAELVADLKGINLETFKRQMEKNAYDVFPKLKVEK